MNIRFMYLPEILILTLQKINPLNKTKNFNIVNLKNLLIWIIMLIENVYIQKKLFMIYLALLII